MLLDSWQEIGREAQVQACKVHIRSSADKPASCFHSPNRSRRRSGNLPELAPLHPVGSSGWAVAPPTEAEQQLDVQQQQQHQQSMQQERPQQLKHPQMQSQPQPQLQPQPPPQPQLEQQLQQPGEQWLLDSGAGAAQWGTQSPRRKTHSAAASTAAGGGGIGGRRATRSAGAASVALPSALKRSPAAKRRLPAKATKADAARAADATASGAALSAATTTKGSQPAAAAAAGPRSSLSTDTAEWRVQPTLGQSAGAGEEAASPPAETLPPAKRRRRVCFAQQPDDVATAEAQAPAVPPPSRFRKGPRSARTAIDALSGRRVPLNPEAASGGAAAEPGSVEVPVELVADARLGFRRPDSCTAAATGASPASASASSPPALVKYGMNAAAYAGTVASPPMPLPLLPPPSPPPQQQEHHHQQQQQPPPAQQQVVLPPQRVVPQPGQQQAQASSAQPGFLAPGEAPDQAANVTAFRAALLGSPAAARRHSAAWWLARQDPEVRRGQSVSSLPEIRF